MKPHETAAFELMQIAYAHAFHETKDVPMSLSELPEDLRKRCGELADYFKSFATAGSDSRFMVGCLDAIIPGGASVTQEAPGPRGTSWWMDEVKGFSFLHVESLLTGPVRRGVKW